jgi:hypothetical protein
MPATFDNDYSDSQAKLPGRETVTYRAATDNAGSYTNYTVASAIRYPITLKEAATSNGVYTANDVVWTLGESQVDTAGFTPKPRDIILDDAGQSWTVLDTVHAMLGRFWKFTTRNLAIVNSLKDTVNVQHPTITQTAAGHRSVAWSTVASSVSCRVQSRTVNGFDDRGVRSTETVYDVYFAAPIAATTATGDFARLVFGSINLQIVNYTQDDHIDALPLAECRAVP